MDGSEILHKLVDGQNALITLYLQCFTGTPIVPNWCRILSIHSRTVWPGLGSPTPEVNGLAEGNSYRKHMFLLGKKQGVPHVFP